MAPIHSTLNLQDRPHVATCARNIHYGHDRFLLPQHWSLHAYQYHARLWLDDSPIEISPGSVTLVPPATVMEYRYSGPSSHIYAHFTVPPVPSQANSWSLPIFYNLGDSFSCFDADMGVVAQTLAFNRLRAEIKLWDLLWKLAEYGHNLHSQFHPSLEKAISLIELGLGANISIANLAHEVGVSHNHLTRLFQHHVGLTVVAYIRQQRARRAKHLLQHTTIPIKAIAAQVHSADRQSFSALVKKETGHSPTHWRQQSEI